MYISSGYLMTMRILHLAPQAEEETVNLDLVPRVPGKGTGRGSVMNIGLEQLEEALN